MDHEPASKKWSNVGPELWWTRLKELALLPGFWRVMAKKFRQARDRN